MKEKLGDCVVAAGNTYLFTFTITLQSFVVFDKPVLVRDDVAVLGSHFVADVSFEEEVEGVHSERSTYEWG